MITCNLSEFDVTCMHAAYLLFWPILLHMLSLCTWLPRVGCVHWVEPMGDKFGWVFRRQCYIWYSRQDPLCAEVWLLDRWCYRSHFLMTRPGNRGFTTLRVGQMSTSGTLDRSWSGSSCGSLGKLFQCLSEAVKMSYDKAKKAYKSSSSQAVASMTGRPMVDHMSVDTCFGSMHLQSLGASPRSSGPPGPGFPVLSETLKCSL